MSKAAAQRVHLRRRAAERLGIALAPSTAARLVREIQSGKAEFVERRTNRISLFRVEVVGRWCVAAYDKNRHQVVTLWPESIVPEGDPELLRLDPRANYESLDPDQRGEGEEV